MSNNNGKKDIISPITITTCTRNSKIVLSSAKRTFRPLQQQPLAQFPPPPFAVAVVKGVDDIGSSNDNKKEKLTMSRPESKVPRRRRKNWDLNEERTATPRQGISEIAQLRNELRYMQSKCNWLIKEHDMAIKNLIKEHKTAIATLTKKHEAAIKDYKIMAESNTNLLTSIDETQTSSLGGSDHYDTPCRHSDSPETSGEKAPPAESFESICIKHMQHVDRLHQMIMEEEAKVHDEKQIIVYVDAEKKQTNFKDPHTDFIISYNSLNLDKCPVSPIASVDSSWVGQESMPIEPVMMRLPSTTSFKKLVVCDADFGTKIDDDRPLATSTGVAKKCFLVPPLHSEILAMKPKYLANHHHRGRESTEESIISGLTMPTSLLHPARKARPPASIYAEMTFESNLLRLLDKRSKNDITSGDIATTALACEPKLDPVVEINNSVRHCKDVQALN